MRNFLFLFVLVASANCFYIDNGKSKAGKIVGGYPTRIDAAPYQVQILFDGSQECGGSIISEYWILTAAHCFENEVRHITVITQSDHAHSGQQREVESIIFHHRYNVDTFDNDITLIKLVKPIVFNDKQQPIEITRVPPKVGQRIKISGFGRIREKGPRSPILRVAWVPVIDHAECEEAYFPDVVTINMFCAGEGKTDSCQGDSGGPAVIDDKLVGIVSWGNKCGSSVHPGIYTQLYRYHKWIAQITGLTL